MGHTTAVELTDGWSAEIRTEDGYVRLGLGGHPDDIPMTPEQALELLVALSAAATSLLPEDETESGERTYADGLRRAGEFVEAAAVRWPAHDHAIAEIRDEIDRELAEVES